jgi:predicted nucleotidyltransferase
MKSASTFDEIVQKLRANRASLREKYGVQSLEIFGSVVQKRGRKNSDVDLLIEFDKNAALTLLQFIALERDLSKLVGRKVDLVEKGTLKPAIGRRIMKEAIPI